MQIHNFESFLNEKEQGFSGEAKNLKDFMKLIDKLPDTIKSISVQSDLNVFDPNRVEIKPTQKNWKKEVEKVLSNALKSKEGKEVDNISLRSYYGPGGPTDPYYIMLSTERSRRFDAEMSSGKHGRLD